MIVPWELARDRSTGNLEGLSDREAPPVAHTDEITNARTTNTS